MGDGLRVNGTSRIPLADGFAVLTQDSGHDNATNSDPARSGDRAFHFDARAREDNSYRSYGRATVVAKEILNAFYGRYPARSYFAGCSEGGREAVMMTQRYPTYFDGILAGAPLLEAPQAALVRPAHILQTYAVLAREQGRMDRNGLPFLNQAFSDADLAVLSGGIARACDGLDGVVDGISQDFRACTAAFDPASLVCPAGRTEGCLSAAQAEAVRTQMAGIPGDHRWHYDLGAVAGQFRSWWLGPATAPQTSSLWVNRPGTTSYITPVPAVDMRAEGGSGPYRSWLGFDAARDRPAIFATTPEQPQSTWDMMHATHPDLTPFVARGGRMVLFHGVSDGAFPIARTIAWLEGVDAVGPGRLADFGRFYPVPGMGHCRGGPATSEFDLLTPLVRWTEEGVAPAAAEARASAGTPWPGRTRPFCAYPSVATYDGSGDVERAESFRCATP
ncbi:tannase/feruloyl esterase family alpha/beta hydrolase [Roseomonas chloroacetimidivorans]|uniref:tannase/feruloyl esterase family alpha/beta hydrolase n=1 Tax=Roseomonas chloroacetimidivorans TaxID=1766656 RepID=UPI003C774C5E